MWFLELNVLLLNKIYGCLQGWARVPKFAFPRSWHFRNAGAWEHKFFTGMREQGPQKSRKANFAFLNFNKYM